MTIVHADDWLTVHSGDCRAVMATMPERSVHCVVTSPPYYALRDYGVAGQIGMEATADEYVAAMVQVFRQVRRVMRDDATCWLNLGDSFGNKQLLGIPWRVAFALQADGWYLRSDIIWAKPNPMPESVTDRPTKSHEYLFLLAKSPTYYFDADAVREAPAESTLDRAAYKVGGGKYDASRNDSDMGTRKSFADYAGGRNIRSVWYDKGDEAVQSVRSGEARRGLLPAQLDLQALLSGEGHGVAGNAGGSPQGDRGEPPVRSDGQGQSGPEGSRGVGAQAGADGRVQGLPGGPGGAASSEPIRSRQGSGGAVLHVGEGQGRPAQEATDAARQGERGEVQAQAPDAAGRVVHDDGCRMGDHQVGADGCLCLLPDRGAADDGPLPAAESRRPAHAGECCGCVPTLQQQQEGADRRGVDRGGLTDTWTIATQPYPGAHFATFPPKLVEPCILAGTSERGVCAECGSPWRRVVERETVPLQRTYNGAVKTEESMTPAGVRWGGSGVPSRTETTTTGWQPTCDHDAPTVPATVLDPFGGSGTTAMVAQHLSRRAVLIDLNPDYIRQQMERNASMPLGLEAA